jgi:hypothetical protein
MEFITKTTTNTIEEPEKENEIEEQNEKLEEFEQKIEDFRKKIEELEERVEKHKHSGKDTADISNILAERLGLKIGTMTGGATSVSFDLAGILVSVGRAAVGETKVYSLLGQSFGIEWSGGGDPYFTTDADFVVPSFLSDGTAINGSIYYNTTTNELKAYINGGWRTISYT